MNRSEIIREICNALEDHSQEYDYGQVEKLFDRWIEAKQPIIDVLRKHPNWNESLMAVSFDQDIEREVNLHVVYNGLHDMKKYVGTMFKTKVRTREDFISEYGLRFHNKIPCGFNEDMEKYCGKEVTVYSVIDSVVNSHELASWTWHIEMFEDREELKKMNQDNNIKIMNDLLNHIGVLDSKITEESKKLFDRLDIKAVVGQKTSRVLNTYLKSVGLNESSMGYTTTDTGKKVSVFNSTYCKIADALNPLTIKRHTLLSVHPVDYLLMSNGNSWQSCHNIDSGCYMVGTLSYMCDPSSMIFYTVDKDYAGDRIYTEQKINRNVFCYEGNMLLQSRVYPENSTSLRKQFREVVQNILATALNIPNYWIGMSSDEDILVTDDDSYHYRDYDCDDYRNIAMLKDTVKNEIHIGSKAYCINCGDVLDEAGSLHCGGCDGSYHTCACCGREVDDEDARMIDGEYYCENCTYYCEDCEEYVLETFLVHDDGNRERYVCESCRDNNYTECEDCGEYYEVINDLNMGNRNDISVCDDCMENYAYCEKCECYYDCDDMNGELCDDCYNEQEEETEDESLDEAV